MVALQNVTSFWDTCKATGMAPVAPAFSNNSKSGQKHKAYLVILIKRNHMKNTRNAPIVQ
jgi:hypothetical protein